MKIHYRFTGLVLALLAGLLLVQVSPSVMAQGPDSRAGGVLQALAAKGIKGKILTRRHVYYSGDRLEISLRFARGANLVMDGQVDAYVVMFTPEEGVEPVVVPVSRLASRSVRRLFVVDGVDISRLAAGQYQLGLIVTEPGGNPLLVDDWHNSLRGLLDIVGVRITDEPIDDDEDGDGSIDGDTNGDGFSDD